MEGYLRYQWSPRKSPHGPQIKKAATTAYASFLSILYLKDTDQMKYGSFIKKMAEDFATGWENIYTYIRDAQHILSTHMTKLIMISKKSNEMITTKVTCPQRMMIILPLGMYPI